MSEHCRRRVDCRLCGGTRLTLVVSLTPTPPANAFVPATQLRQPQAVFPLDLHFCEDCHHLQLSDVVDPALLFQHYVYVSGTSPVFVRHFRQCAHDLAATLRLSPGALVVDVGSNDGTLLRAFADQGARVLGVDPAEEIAARANAAGIPTVTGFFTPALARQLRTDHGPATLVTANNVFAHADDLAGMWEGIRHLLAESGSFVFEVSYLRDVIEKVLFDTVYHEHLAYHSVAPLQRFFAAHGGELFRVERIDTHGGSLRGFARRSSGEGSGSVDDTSVATLMAGETAIGLDQAATFRTWAGRIEALGNELRALLSGLRARGKRIAGFGAPAKATTLMHHFGLGPDTIEFIADDSPLKQGLFTPGLHVPVLPASAIAERRPDYLLLLAWNFAPSIVARQQAFRAAGGRFIVPLPELEVV